MRNACRLGWVLSDFGCSYRLFELDLDRGLLRARVSIVKAELSRSAIALRFTMAHGCSRQEGPSTSDATVQ